MRVVHGAGVKAIDLVVVTIGNDHGLRRIAVLDRSHEFGGDALPAQALQISAAITADRGHGQRCPAELLEAVGNVAGTTAEITPERWHQKRDIQYVQLIRQNLIGKAALEVHDGVESQRAEDDGSHMVYWLVQG